MQAGCWGKHHYCGLLLRLRTQEEQSPTAILGSLLKQVASGLCEVPQTIVQAFREREMVIGGQRLGLAEIVEFLQDISYSRPHLYALML